MLIKALGVGGSEPFTTTPLLSLHFRLPKNNNAAAKAMKNNAQAVLMPAMAPFDKSGGLPLLADADMLVDTDTEPELVHKKVGVEGDGEGHGEIVIDADVDFDVGFDADVDFDVGFDVDVDSDVGFDADVDFDDAVVLNIAAPFVLLDSFAATKLLVGQPSSLLQALIEQQPRKGVSKPEQVYQSPLPEQD